MGAGNSASTSGSNMQYSSQNSAPWSPQSGYLTTAWQNAQDAYANQQNNPYKGQFASGPTSGQYGAYNTASNAATNVLGSSANQLNSGQDYMTQGSNYSNQGATGLQNTLAGNTVDNHISNAQKFAAGFDPNKQASSAMTGAKQDLADNTIPNIYRQGSAAGGINSSNAALMQSNAEAKFGQQEAALANQYAAQEFNQGYTNSQGTTNSNIQGYGALGALGSNMYSGGNTAVNSGVSNANTGATMGVNAANGTQNLNQLKNTSDLSNYLGNYKLSQDNLNNLWNIVGGKSWGGTTTGTSYGTKQDTTQQTPSTMSTIGSGLGSLGSLFGTGGSGGLLGSLGSLFGVKLGGN